MRRFPPLAILAAVLSGASCSSMEYDRLAEDYRHRSPVAEADSDFTAGDSRIYSAMGVGRYFPGLAQEEGRVLASRHGDRMIQGTTDALMGKAESRFIGASTDFAARYNQRKAELIQQSAAGHGP